MGRNDEISIAKCCNYTDLREKKEQLPQIEVESIKAYARGLNEEGLKIFLDELSDEELISAIHLRLIRRKNKLDGIKRYIDELA